MELRDYQEKAVAGIRGAFRAVDRVFLALPTGGGKTVIFSYITQNAVSRGSKVLILVHRRELVCQTSTTLTFLGVNHGIIAAKFRSNDCSVQVASVQTLVRRLHKVDFEPDLIIIDEAHHAVAGSWATVLDHFSSAKLLGVSATPERLDKKGLDEHFDVLIQGPQVKELIEQGFLSPVKCFSLPNEFERNKIKKRQGDFLMGEAANEIREMRLEGDAILEYEKHCPGKPAVVFCCTIDHAEYMAQKFAEAGYRSECLSSRTTDENRADYIRRLGNGGLDILTSCNVISEGTDIPVVTCGILMRPTESTGLFLQQVGRVLRTAEGKDHAVIIDCVGNIEVHGLPQAERHWSLAAPPKKPPAPSVKVCPKCFACLPSDTEECPLCGHLFVKEADGEDSEREYLDVETTDLVEIDEKTFLSKAERRDRRKRIRAAGDDRQKLEALRREFGYKPGWVYFRIKETRKAKAKNADFFAADTFFF